MSGAKLISHENRNPKLRPMKWILPPLLAVVGLAFCMRLLVPTLPPAHALSPTDFVLSWISPYQENTRSVAWGDMDGDGDLDLAIGNNNALNRLYRNDGAGNLTEVAGALGPSISGTSSIAWGDMDGDGDLDLAIGNRNAANQLFRNDGGGNLVELGGALGTLVSPTVIVAWGDMDGDGDLDLAVGNENVNANQIYRNKGGGVFVEISNALTDTQDTNSLAWGDMDGDGDLDLVVANWQEVNQIYRNDGTGNLTKISGALTDSQSYTSVAWGDMDGDNDLDLVFGNRDDDSHLYRNDGSGNFVRVTGVLTDTGSARDVDWGDADGDGDLDLLISISLQPDQLHRNDGTGHFAVVDLIDLDDKIPWDSAWGDADGDGDLDLAVGNADAVNQLYINNQGVEFVELEDALGAVDEATKIVAWADVDGDGDLDLAVGDYNRVNRIYRNVGEGTFVEAINALGSHISKTYDLAWGDMDGDGDLDLAVGNTVFERNQIYRNDGEFNFTEVVDALGVITNSTASMAWGDMDGDGDLDLAVGNSQAANQLYQNDGYGSFVELEYPFGKEANKTSCIAWGDMDRDGDLDLVIGNSESINQLYRNDGEGNFAEVVNALGSDTRETSSIAWADTDGDGDLDLVIGNYNDINQLYLNNGSGGFTEAVGALGMDTDATNSVAVGDVDGDGDLDLAVGNSGDVNKLYRNNGNGSFTEMIQALGAEDQGSHSIAWGDMDGDGDLDLAVGNSYEINQIYRNEDQERDGLPNNPPYLQVSRPISTAGASFYNTPSILENQTIPITYTLFDSDGGPVGHISASYSMDGGGYWLPAAATDTVTSHLSLGSALSFDGIDDWADTDDFDIANDFTVSMWVQPVSTTTNQAFIAKNTNVGGNLFLFGFINDGYYLNIRNISFVSGTQTTGWQHLAVVGEQTDVATTTVTVYRNGEFLWQHDFGILIGTLIPGKAWTLGQEWDAGPVRSDFFRGRIDEVRIWNGARTQAEIRTDMYRQLVGNESGLVAYWPLDKGIGKEFSDQTSNGHDGVMSSTTSERPRWVGGPFTTRVYTWDTYTSGFFGQSDNVLFRLEAYPQPPNATSPGTHHYLHSLPDPQQHPYAAATTLPFRVRGTQIRVYDEAIAPGNELAGAMVYRLAEGWSAAQPYASDSGTPFTTDVYGYLKGRGELYSGDQLIALYPISATESYTMVITSASPTLTGLDAYTVTGHGVQNLAVSTDNPLILFNLDISLEWDARQDAPFMEQLEYDLQRTSELLYDWTNGQATLGRIRIYHDRQLWNDAHIRIYGSNRMRPNASQGGIVSTPRTDQISATTVITYWPGQVRMGATWNRYGESGGTLGEDWPRTLAHELGHYALYLDDDYLGLQDGQLVSVDSCTHTAMSDPYREDYSEFRVGDVNWDIDCANTLANQITGRADWETIKAMYPGLSQGTNPGPNTLPLAVTRIQVIEPVTPTETLAVPIFNLSQGGSRVQPAGSARAVLFQGDWLIDLGSPTLDRVTARGAQPGDRLCVYEPAAQRLGCEIISDGDTQLELSAVPDWQPDITLSPVNSRTLDILVGNIATSTWTLQARLYPMNNPATDPITLTKAAGIYSGTFSLDVPALEGFIQVWVKDVTPPREIVTDFSLGGNPGFSWSRSGFSWSRSGFSWSRSGFSWSRSAPTISSDGQVILFGPDLDDSTEWFYTLQAATSVPQTPVWATPVGQPYRVSASDSAPDLTETSISVYYMGSEVPPGEETWLRLYYLAPASTTWKLLPTTLDTYHNLATAPTQGEGLYILMSSLEISLYGPGWNLVAYPVVGTRPVTEALQSISGTYGIVCGYDETDPVDPWSIYGPDAPVWVNDLTELSFGRGYWISATQAITLYLKGGSDHLAGDVQSFPFPPAVYYGQVLSGTDFAPISGTTVTAWVDGHFCGQGETQEIDEQIVYVLKVSADDGWEGSGCGAPGRAVSFRVGTQDMAPTATWDNRQLWEHSLHPPFMTYLPIIQ